MRTTMCLLSATALVTLLGWIDPLGLSWTAQADNNFKVVTNLTEKGEIPADLAALEVENPVGSIHLVGVESGAMEWNWKLTVRARSEQLAQKAAAQAGCKASRQGDKLRLVVTLPNSDAQQSLQSDLDLRVPRSVRVHTRTAFGSTEIANLNSEVEASGQNGSVSVRNVRGSVRAQTAFGSLEVSETGGASLKNQNGRIEASHIRGALTAETSFGSLVASEIGGPVKLRNQNGAIEVRHAAGAVDLKTSFNKLEAEDIQGQATLHNQNGEVRARKVSGSVEAQTSFAKLDVEAAGPSLSCRNQNGVILLRALSGALTNLEASTTFNSLEVSLPAALKPAIEARTSFGKVESDFPVVLNSQGTQATAEAPPNAPRVLLHNQNGSIRIVRHEGR